MATNSRANSADAIQICGPIVDHETTLQRRTHLGFLCRHHWEICSAGSSPDTIDPSNASVSNPILTCPSKRTTLARHPNRRLLSFVAPDDMRGGNIRLATGQVHAQKRRPIYRSPHAVHEFPQHTKYIRTWEAGALTYCAEVLAVGNRSDCITVLQRRDWYRSKLLKDRACAWETRKNVYLDRLEITNRFPVCCPQSPVA